MRCQREIQNSLRRLFLSRDHARNHVVQTREKLTFSIIKQNSAAARYIQFRIVSAFEVYAKVGDLCKGSQDDIPPGDREYAHIY